MSLTADSRLGPYEIMALVGADGMGEVYCRLHNGVATTFAPEARVARRARRRTGKITSFGRADEARAGSGWPLPR